MAMPSPTDVNAHQLHGTSSTRPLCALPNLCARMPVLGPLRQIVKMFPLKYQDETKQSSQAAMLAWRSPLSTPSSQSLGCSGYTTPLSSSPYVLDLTTLDHSRTTQCYNEEELKSNAAEMAVRLWMMARDPVRCPDPRWRAQARMMQIDAVRYMHMALPADLTAAETATIRGSVPHQVLSDQPNIQSDLKPTALRRAVAQAVALVMAALVFLLPIMTLCINAALSYERDHHITGRVLARAQATVSGFGQYGFRLQSTLLHFLHSPRGERLVASGAYLVEGIAGGVMDGCGYQNASRGTEGISWTGPQTETRLPVRGARGP